MMLAHEACFLAGPQAFVATGPNYSAVIPAALSRDDARRIACEDSGLMPWQVDVRLAHPTPGEPND